MPFDYDLVILGGTAYARRAALQSAGYGARVALVEPPGLFDQGQRQQYVFYGLQQLGETRQRQAVGEWFGLSLGQLNKISNGGEASEARLDWPAVLEWGTIAAETQLAHLSPDTMNERGVDVVLEAPERLTRKLSVITENRQLQARGVLAAFGHVPAAIQPLQQMQTLPASISIVGGTPEAWEWAWALRDCGVQVELVADGLLPGEDQDIQQLVRSQLIAAGIHVRYAHEQPDNPVLSEHTLLIEPTTPALTLPDFISLKTNRYLQTNHPRVFACGSILGGSTHDDLAQFEADVAVRNALFWPSAKVDYAKLPQSYVRFAKIGLTEAQAKKQYGSAVQTFKVSRANAACLSRTIPMPDYGKLVYANNQLVGAHFLGQGASRWLQQWSPKVGCPIAAVDVRDLESSDISASDWNEVLASIRRSRWQPGRWRRDWAENWFNWRRSR